VGSDWSISSSSSAARVPGVLAAADGRPDRSQDGRVRELCRAEGHRLHQPWWRRRTVTVGPSGEASKLLQSLKLYRPAGAVACNGRDMTPTRDQDLVAQSLPLQLQAKRAELMLSELEEVALRLFDQRGFANVTVEDLATEAHISVRTFYRYFPSKEEVLQLRIVRRSELLRQALETRPADEAPLRSLRVALEEEFSATDPIALRRWVAVVADNPNVLRGVVGAIQLRIQPVIAEFLRSRLQLPSESLVPTILAAAALGVVQAVHTQWFVHNGDFATTMSESLTVLEKTISTDLRVLGVGVDDRSTVRRSGGPKRRGTRPS
jgi:TetR/AcrR family transcriptional regulator, regulator of mycofactocin system